MAEYILGGLTYISPVAIPGSVPAAVAPIIGSRPVAYAPAVTSGGPSIIAARPATAAPFVSSGSGYGDRFPVLPGAPGSPSWTGLPSGRTTPAGAPPDPRVSTGEGVDTGVDLHADSVTGVLPDGTTITVKAGVPVPTEKAKSNLVWWGLGALVLVAGGAIWWSTR